MTMIERLELLLLTLDESLEEVEQMNEEIQQGDEK